ncbi:salicylate 1-monooxygenase [Fusarium heterosporum]|uniref:Salicylate 1-monooxygenase n=1 Tax=Fusarium heterosporum TaxID=42747 RepID=A0A8H5TIZ3_FUSHE|nr:salicylate 1-monooxygenase [Fusarium heterosporum]
MPLKVIIAGGGLGGLGAAIAMARAGHNVEVFEQSSFLNEIGAAIHIAPNATRVLRSWEIDFTDLQAVLCNAIKVYDNMGKLISVPVKLEELQQKIGRKDEWLLTHRVDLHNTLRKAATGKEYADRIIIHTASKVVAAAKTGEITLANGAKHSGDLLIGADGVHSKVFSSVAGSVPKRVSTKQNTFRFLVPIDKLMENPITGPFFSKLGFDCQHVFTTRDRRMVIYPCRNAKLFNIVAMHPAEDAGLESESSWLAGGKVEDLLEVYKEFGPELIELCRIGEDLKLWSLATRDPPPSSTMAGQFCLAMLRTRCFLVNQGQGGAQSFEDAAALGILFPASTTVADVPKRLKLYNQLRYPRSVTVMFMSKINDERRGEMMDDLRKFVPDAELPPNIFPYLWNNNVLDDAQKALVAAA